MSAAFVAASLAFLLISVLLSAGEAAIFALSESRIRTLEQEGFTGAGSVSAVRDQAEPVRAAVFLLNGLANLAAVAFLVGAEVLAWGGAGAAVSVPITIVAVFFLGEVGPRVAVTRRPVRIALAAAPVLSRAERLVRPLASLIRLEGLLSGRNGEEASTDQVAVRELSRLGQEEGIVGEEEHLLVERAFRLDELSAWDAMTPRVDIFAWSDALVLSEIIDELERVPYSRVPVYGDSIDDVTGILYVREAYQFYVSGRTDVTLARIARDPFFVPGSLSLTRLLKDFQARRIHMGIVADEFGGTDGLVTLEDVLEELVGEIVDETDVDEEPLHRISRNELVADGSVDLREINYAFNVTLPQLEHRSLNGFILEELGEVPDAGEIIERDGVEIEILEATDTQVLRARLRKIPTTGDEGEAA
ncbi:MAG: DUF21 domain-containing protein [Gemmatimonadetes bacterium]|nr:HlyC/CorC family transporter [Gemmatimonadota bacterium]NIR80634.1 HlyC/CorC family transporter [Gemmatimonadota bacterium]NIT89424.1 HlyC/CorC family transporter [Gemmatimonadota bacterium]NIU33225.1 HlyC/CorC family transporter [Gemmatimonadota bacterium]NIU37544.1 DUF21 domain-containing protein [Gemmatimonadota bacterium]